MAKSKIIKELANNEITIDVALNRLLVIASDLNNDKLAIWAESELQGYKKDEDLPSYRKLKSLRFTYSGFNGNCSVRNAPFVYIDIVKKYVPNALDVSIRDSVSALQKYSNNHKEQLYCVDYTFLSGYVYQETGIECSQIVQHIPVNYLQNILSQIKTLLIKVFLKLDMEYGCLDALDVDTESKTEDEIQKINTVVNNYIYYVDESISIGDKNKIESSDIVSGGNTNG